MVLLCVQLFKFYLLKEMWHKFSATHKEFHKDVWIEFNIIMKCNVQIITINNCLLDKLEEKTLRCIWNIDVFFPIYKEKSS